MEGIVFDQKTGRIGNQRLLRNSKKEAEWGSNYEVAILDPITLDEIAIGPLVFTIIAGNGYGSLMRTSELFL